MRADVNRGEAAISFKTACDLSAGGYHAMALNGYANALTKLNRHEEAVDAYDIVLAKQPEPETRSRLLRAKALAGSGRTDEAIEEFSVGIKALKAEQKGKKKEADAEDQAGTGLKLMATAHFERGNAYLARKDEESQKLACKDFTRALKVPRPPPAPAPLLAAPGPASAGSAAPERAAAPTVACSAAAIDLAQAKH